MNLEENIIRTIRKILPKSNLQINELFESDSEILKFGKEKLLINIDTFSKEDNFYENDFYTLGWNLAVGGISDILANGGTPVFYGHSLAIKKDWDKSKIEKLMQGVKSVLRQTGTHFIGGDFGVQSDWSYTAVVIGKFNNNCLLRKNAKQGDLICISGKIGAGNLEAAINLFNKEKKINFIKNKFQIRLKESKLIKEYSKCCIDTSDGVFNALNTISKQSNTGYIIHDIPYIKKGFIVSKLFSLPYELLFLCECGEYELLFSIPKEKEINFFNEAKKKKLKFYKIGIITDFKKKILMNKNKKIDLSTINVRARDFNYIKDYINHLINCLKREKNE